jgi:uncharacterized protein YbaR (Trm112 family)
MISKQLLNILVCPLCKGRLIYNAQDARLICHLDHVAYKIKNGVPIMIPEQATRLNGE